MHCRFAATCASLLGRTASHAANSNPMQTRSSARGSKSGIAIYAYLCGSASHAATSATASGSCSRPCSAAAAMLHLAPGNHTQSSGLLPLPSCSTRSGCVEKAKPITSRKRGQKCSGWCTDAACRRSHCCSSCTLLCESASARAAHRAMASLRSEQAGSCSSSGCCCMNRAAFVHAAVCGVGQ